MEPKYMLYDLFKIFVLFCLNHIFYIDTEVKIPIQTIYVQDFYIRKYPELEIKFKKKKKNYINIFTKEV